MLRKTKIVCTVGKISKKKLGKTIEGFIEKGMDVARINMSHFDVRQRDDKEYLKDLIKTIRKKSGGLEKDVAILGDIQGPKVRIIELFDGKKKHKKLRLKPRKKFVLAYQKSSAEGKGALIGHEGMFDFFQSIKDNVQKDDGKPKPIEFWFGDGKVILQTSVDNISDGSALCTVKVPGILEVGKGVSVKNSKIDPGDYSLKKYKKDQRDIKFLLAHGIDILALSFVNSGKDVENLQEFIGLKLGEGNAKDRLLGLDRFPVISKIETWDGYDKLDEIMEVSYGILVGRGDLALQTGIEKVGILQKDIIDRCIARGKPVITATQMLLSMMDFVEPRRSEVADVTNAVYDGSDALMLSEETAHEESKYRLESIEMMRKIIVTTEGKRAGSRINYEYEIDMQHAKALEILKKMKDDWKQSCMSHGGHHDHNRCEKRMHAIRAIEDTEHISYDACKTAYELDCTAIVVSTDTGRTARVISKFGPDVPILAGVTVPTKKARIGIARILRLSYGVEPFIISHNARDAFNELEQTIRRARDSKRLKREYKECQEILGQDGPAEPFKIGDRVIFVAGYPPGPGATTFLDIYEISEGKKTRASITKSTN